MEKIKKQLILLVIAWINNQKFSNVKTHYKIIKVNGIKRWVNLLMQNNSNKTSFYFRVFFTLSFKQNKLFHNMSFSITANKINESNINKSASLPTSEDIVLNNCSWENNIEFLLWEETEIEESYRFEYNENINKGIYFFGCPLKIYTENFYPRFNEFLKDYPDAPEHRFILEELILIKKGFNFPFVDKKMKINIEFSLDKTYNFLMEKLDTLGYEIFELEINEELLTPANFITHSYRKKSNFKPEYLVQPMDVKLNQAQFMELFKALFDTGALLYKNQSVALNHFSQLFNMQINNPHIVLQNIKNRNNEEEAKFIDKLKSTLLKFINKKNTL